MAKITLEDKNLSSFDGIHLYFHPLSNNAKRVHFYLKESSLGFEEHVINLIKERDVYSKIKYPFYMRIMFKMAVEIKRLFGKYV